MQRVVANNEWLLARLGQGFFESWYMYWWRDLGKRLVPLSFCIWGLSFQTNLFNCEADPLSLHWVNNNFTFYFSLRITSHFTSPLFSKVLIKSLSKGGGVRPFAPPPVTPLDADHHLYCLMPLSIPGQPYLHGPHLLVYLTPCCQQIITISIIFVHILWLHKYHKR